MTAEELKAILQRADQAAPGPWKSADCIRPRLELYYKDPKTGEYDHIGGSYCDGSGQARRNLDFIANARTDVPRLVAEIQRLSAEVAWLNAELTILSGLLLGSDAEG